MNAAGLGAVALVMQWLIIYFRGHATTQLNEIAGEVGGESPRYKTRTS